VGPFEEEEEGTGIASDVVMVKREDPATPGGKSPALRNDPRTERFPNIGLIKTKKHTLGGTPRTNGECVFTGGGRGFFIAKQHPLGEV